MEAMRVENAIGMTVWANAVDMPQKVGDLIRVTINRVEPSKDDGGPAYPSTRPFVGIPTPSFTHSYTTGQPLNPNSHHSFSPHPFSGTEATESFPGMSLRDHFAAQALSSLAHGFNFSTEGNKDLATKSYEIADAMLEARKR